MSEKNTLYYNRPIIIHSVTPYQASAHTNHLPKRRTKNETAAVPSVVCSTTRKQI